MGKPINPDNSSDRGSEHGQTPARPFEQLQALLPTQPGVRISEDHILSLISARRGREALFGRHLFSDPAWDVILEVYAAKLGGRRISVSDIARSNGIPEPVTVRWIAALADAGILVTTDDSHDFADTSVELSEGGAEKMARLARKWSTAFVSI